MKISPQVCPNIAQIYYPNHYIGNILGMPTVALPSALSYAYEAMTQRKETTEIGNSILFEEEKYSYIRTVSFHGINFP